jgi:hypothetical protein
MMSMLQRYMLVPSSGENMWIDISRSICTAITASVVYWSEFLATDSEVLVLFPALPDFLRNSGSGTWSTQLRE